MVIGRALAKLFEVAGQLGDMNVPTTVSKDGRYREDTLADLVVRSPEMDADFFGGCRKWQNQSAVAASQNGETVINYFYSAHAMFLRLNQDFIVAPTAKAVRPKGDQNGRLSDAQ